MKCLSNKVKFIFSCEHASNKIPLKYNYLFKGKENIILSHRGYDIGVYEIAKKISSQLKTKFFYGKYSRLLIDLNRTLNNTKIFSEFTKTLTSKEQSIIIDKYYLPYRNRVENEISDLIKKKYMVIHFSFHSFTPVMNNKIRNLDIGLLYDPKRQTEKNICSDLKKKFFQINHKLIIKFNNPYRGISDRFTTYLRKKFQPSNYAGIEIEINQKFFLNRNEKI